MTAWIIAETAGIVDVVLGFFSRGGLFMWPLLICSIVSVTIMILRGLALRRKIVLPSAIESEIERMTPGESPERLSRLVYHDPSSLARITRVALQHVRGPRSENVEVVQTRARHEMVRLERGLIILEVIVGIAPLLGLDWRCVRVGARFLAPRLKLRRRIGYEADRARHRRSIKRNRLRTFHRRADTGRVHLFLPKSGSDVGRDGNARGRVDQQMLLRPLHARTQDSADSDLRRVKRATHFA